MKKNDIEILYVEDEESIQKQLVRFISRFCTKIYLAQNGQEGLELYKQYKPDIIISDISMPVMNGIEMIKEIKKIDPEPIAIFISAHSESKYLFDAINMQIDAYILKPIDFSIFEEKLNKLIQMHENRKVMQKLKESEEKFRKIASNSQIGIFIYKEKFIYVNEAFCNLSGYTKEELYNISPVQMVEHTKQEEISQIIKRRLQGEIFTKEHSDLKVFTKNHDYKYCRVSTSTIAIDGDFAGLGTLLDITDLINTQEQLYIYKQVIEQMDGMVLLTDILGQIIFTNKAVTKHTGYSKEELLGKNCSIFQSKKHNKQFYKDLWNTILKGEIYTNIFINKKKNNELYYEDKTITPIFDIKNKELKYFVSTGKDISERIKMEEELKKLATVDTLTGAYNRYKINQIIDHEIIRTKRYNEPFSLIMFDIDHFKEVNDTYGHDIGDIVLKEFTHVVLSSIRGSDMFGRWGGEEFMLVTPRTTLKDALNLAQKLRQKVEKYTFTEVKHITVSLGVTLFTKESKKELILKEVDDALYKSKENGRNQVSTV